MIRTFGKILFYGRFLRSFSTIGWRRRAAAWPEFQPDFSGQRWLVTGATGGIGRAVALGAAGFGAEVFAVGRDAGKLAALRRSAGRSGTVRTRKLDLSSIREIRNAARGRIAADGPFDVLVNNVGVLLHHFEQTEEGFERSFATNLLGQFVLTEELHRQGALSERGLVVEVSSGGMYGTPLRLEAMDPRDARSWDGTAAYAMHKRAQVALTRLWNQRWHGHPLVHVMHPGWVDTEGVRSALPVFRAALASVLRTPEQGADTILWLASERPEVPSDGGIWFDRSLQPEHEFAFTRSDAPGPEALGAFLQACADRVPD